MPRSRRDRAGSVRTGVARVWHAGDWLQRHPAKMDVLAARIEERQEEAYRDFVAYVRSRTALSQREQLAQTATAGKEPPMGVGGAGGSAARGGSDGGGEQRPPRVSEVRLEPVQLQRQFDALQESLGETKRARSAKELAALRRIVADEELEEFATQKESLKQDVREALLGRLTAPSLRLQAQLSTDPQVRRALALAANPGEYDRILAPEKQTAEKPLPPASKRMVDAVASSQLSWAEELIFPAEYLV